MKWPVHHQPTGARHCWTLVGREGVAHPLGLRLCHRPSGPIRNLDVTPPSDHTHLRPPASFLVWLRYAENQVRVFGAAYGIEHMQERLTFLKHLGTVIVRTWDLQDPSGYSQSACPAPGEGTQSHASSTIYDVSSKERKDAVRKTAGPLREVRGGTAPRPQSPITSDPPAPPPKERVSARPGSNPPLPRRQAPL